MSDLIVEWEVTMKCNYQCTYCTNLDKTIRPVMDRETVREFVRGLGEQHPGAEIFVFGGEPFLHPDIRWIIRCFNEFKVPFVVQTNYSKYSVEVMKQTIDPFSINISIHPTEIELGDLAKLFKYQPKINRIDVMFTGEEAIQYYFAIKKLLPTFKQLYLTPVTDFGDGVSQEALHKFNELKDHFLWSRMIQFERIERLGRLRSEIWADDDFVTLGKPCLYKDRYFLYGANLELYNCCYRIKTDGTCPKDKCFLM